MSFRSLYDSNDWPAIARACESRFGVECDAAALGRSIRAATNKKAKELTVAGRETGFGNGWSDCTWFMFLKNRLNELGCFTVGCKYAVEGGVTAVMHVFFINIEETPEMLMRLQGEKEAVVTTARTKLTKDTAMFVVPIDGNAARMLQ